MLAFLAESDGELHKGNLITRLGLSPEGKLLPVGLFSFFFFFSILLKEVGVGTDLP